MNNEEKKYIKLTPFKIQVLQSFPFIDADFDALTNYELLCKVVDYLNKTIDNVDVLNDEVEEYITKFNELKAYVDNYFDNLDVQEEINNKLDEMAEDGTLTTLIKNYVDPIQEEFEDEVNESLNQQNLDIINFKNSINTQIGTMNTKINNATSGSPLIASNTSEMTDTTRIYVNITDGKWYYYDGDSWEIGGTYQSTGVGENEINYENLIELIQNQLGYELKNPTLNNGYYIQANGNISNYFATAYYTDPILFHKGEKIIFYGKGSGTNIAMITTCDSSGNNRKVRIISLDNNLQNYIYEVLEDEYFVFSGISDTDTKIYKIKNISYASASLINFLSSMYPFINYNNTTNSSPNKYIRYDNGELGELNGMIASDYLELPIDKGELVLKVNSGNIVNNSDLTGLAFYDENKSFILGIQYQATNEQTINIPLNAKYIRYSINKLMRENYFSINFKSLLDVFKNFNYKINDNKSNTSFSSFIKFGAIGDSLASGESTAKEDGNTIYVDNYDYSWGQFIARKYGMTCINFSKGGLTTRSWLTDNNGLSKLQNPNNKCNAYLIGLGVNDYSLGESYIGTSTDIHTDNPSLNADTYYGNYGKIISAIKEVQPKAKIFLFTMPNQNIGVRNYTNWNTAVRTIATLFNNVYIIDLAQDHDSFFSSGFVRYNYRGGHYNSITYNYIGDYIYKWISEYMFENNDDFEQIEFIGTNYEWTD